MITKALQKDSGKKKHKTNKFRIRRVDIQVCILTAIIVILSCTTIYIYNYYLTYNDAINNLVNRTMSIYEYMEDNLDKSVFTEISSKEDMTKASYAEFQKVLNDAKQATGVMYLYTATQNSNDEYVYLVDGLPLTAEDFRYPGDLIEKEIIPDIKKAMGGEMVLPNKIKSTDWGKIFISYLPIHESEQSNNVVGVIGIEFNAEHQYNTYNNMRIITPIIMLGACLLCTFIAFKVFKRISNPSYKDMANTDYLTGLKNRNSYDTDLKNIERSGNLKNLGFISIDINNLKLVNDQLGHNSGDKYICYVADSLDSAGNDEFAIYRIGGDEFVVLADCKSDNQIIDFVENAYNHFEKIKPNWSIPISFCAGYAIYDSQIDSDWHETFSRADINMYKQKKSSKLTQSILDSKTGILK